MERTAVVVGGGIGGLATAAALAGRFARVVVLERDAVTGGADFRAGVPQGRHLHSLMGAGGRALERLLPGFGDDLYAAGAVPLRTPFDHLWLSPAGWCHRFPPSHTVPSATRPLVEAVLRRRVLELDGVTVRDRTRVTGLVLDSGRVTGARVEGGEVPADLVVDASGRRSDLAGLAPETVRVDARAGYASRLYRIPADAGDEWRVISIQPGPAVPTRGGALVPVEGGRWLVSLYGYLDDHPPTDDAGFLEFARSLRHPVLHDVIAAAEPLGPVHGFRHMASERRRYEAVDDWPDGLLVVGDALCSVNPVYAQGMSMAAMTAVQLRELPDLDCGTAQKEIAAGVERAWVVATGADRAILGAASDGAAGAHMQRVMELALVDAEVNRVFFDVMMMLDEPAALFTPEMRARVAAGPRP